MRRLIRRLVPIAVFTFLAAVRFAAPAIGQQGLETLSAEKDKRSASEILAAAAQSSADQSDRQPASPPAPPTDLDSPPSGGTSTAPTETDPAGAETADAQSAEPANDAPSGESLPAEQATLSPAESEVLESANYRGIVPGQTSRESLHEQWGDPEQVHRIPGGVRETYSSDAFEFVRVTVIEDVVDSLALKLRGSKPVGEIAERLEITKLESVDVYNDEGQWLGLIYPERGILLVFDSQTEQPRATQIVIEPITAESFLARAEVRLNGRFAACLADVQQAKQLAPQNSRCHALESDVLRRAGDLERSIEAAQRAIELAPDEMEHRLTLSRALTLSGEHKLAVQFARDAVEARGVPPLTLAKAHCRLADSLALAPDPDYRQAIKHHMEAAKLAGPLAKDRDPDVRVEAKRVLLDSYLGAAHDIGHGHWQKQSTVVPRWIEQAASVADDIIRNEHGSEELRLRVYEGALSAAAGIAQPPDPGPWVDGITELGGVLVRQSEDEAHQAHLAWRVGVALADATEIETARDHAPRATQLGNMAMAYFSQGEAAVRQLPTRNFVRGWLCYRIGAIHAVDRGDHRQAVSWYRHAVPLLESPTPPSAAYDGASQGETFVSMAVSYWELGQRDEALRLTEQGLELMERAAVDGKLEKPALAVPYGNLSRMHKLMGDVEESEKFEQLAERVEAMRRR